MVNKKAPPHSSPAGVIVGVVLAALFVLAVGLVVGYYVGRRKQAGNPTDEDGADTSAGDIELLAAPKRAQIASVCIDGSVAVAKTDAGVLFAVPMAVAYFIFIIFLTDINLYSYLNYRKKTEICTNEKDCLN